MYINEKGSKGAVELVGLLVTRAVWAPMKERRRNMKVPQNSPRTMTMAFLTRLGMGLPALRSATASSVGKPDMPELARVN